MPKTTKPPCKPAARLIGSYLGPSSNASISTSSMTTHILSDQAVDFKLCIALYCVAIIGVNCSGQNHGGKDQRHHDGGLAEQAELDNRLRRGDDSRAFRRGSERVDSPKPGTSVMIVSRRGVAPPSAEGQHEQDYHHYAVWQGEKEDEPEDVSLRPSGGDPVA